MGEHVLDGFLVGNVTREEEEVEEENKSETVQHEWPCEAVMMRRVTNRKTTQIFFHNFNQTVATAASSFPL